MYVSSHQQDVPPATNSTPQYVATNDVLSSSSLSLNSSFEVVKAAASTTNATPIIDVESSTITNIAGSQRKVDTDTPPNTLDNSPSIAHSDIEEGEEVESSSKIPPSKNFASYTLDCLCPSPDSPVFKQNGSYGWVLVLEGFLASVMTDGSLYAFGVFFPSYVNDFGTDYATASWIGSVASGVTVFFAFHVGYLCDRFGYRSVMVTGALLAGIGYIAAAYSTSIWQLILSQGVVFGLGCSLAYTSGLAIVGQWFTVSRGLAFVIAGSGSGTGQFILAILTGYFLETYGWRLALKYLAILVTGTVLFCAFIMRNITREVNAPPPRPVPRNLLKSLRELLEDKHFFLLYMGYLVVMFGFSMPYAYITIYAQDNGLSNAESYLLLSGTN